MSKSKYTGRVFRFVDKWNTWWMLQDRAEDLDAAFERELEELAEAYSNHCVLCERLNRPIPTFCEWSKSTRP